jgi:hypothetical protein
MRIPIKTRLSAGSFGGFGLAVRRSAVYRSPSFERFVFSGFPACDFRVDHETRLNFKVKRGLILKHDFDDVVIRREGQFNFGNDLALCRWKLVDTL